MVSSFPDVYQRYYTKSFPIVTYMISRLDLRPGQYLLEPCAGDGAFVDAVLEREPSAQVDAYELDPHAAEILASKYRSCSKIRTVRDDSLTSGELDLFGMAGGVYDRVIGNPPYGGWLDYDKRRLLKKLYPGLYVKETYALFLYRCMQLLREGGVLVFITPDTFLNLHMHTHLRDYLLTHTAIRDMCIFPSSLFPGVSFGYSKLCIITLEKCSDTRRCLDNVIRVVYGLRDAGELLTLSSDCSSGRGVMYLLQGEVHSALDHSFFLSAESQVSDLINKAATRIGDVAACVTGLYTGDDRRYLRRSPQAEPGAKSNHEVVDSSRVCPDYHGVGGLLEGIRGDRHFIPIVKGGGHPYCKGDYWYVDWSEDAVRNYKADKRARFQNSRYYFRNGIGVPMVSSSRITAALLDCRVFDQAIVGVFAYDQELLPYLLALLNSHTGNKLIRTINPSANNSANYIKKMPLLIPKRSTLGQINDIVYRIVELARHGAGLPVELQAEVEELIVQTYGF